MITMRTLLILAATLALTDALPRRQAGALETCKDDSSCSIFIGSTKCTNSYMRQYCKKTCNLCGGEPTVGPLQPTAPPTIPPTRSTETLTTFKPTTSSGETEPCKDTPLCSVFIDNNIGCADKIMTQYCKKTCNLCGGATATPPRPTVEPPQPTTEATRPPPTRSTSTTLKPTTSSGGTDHSECGRLPNVNIKDASKLSRRIVGGSETKPHYWPSICTLEYIHWDVKLIDGSLIGYPMKPQQHFESQQQQQQYWRDNFSHKCGSTLVKNDQGQLQIVTAAHCVFGCMKRNAETGECLEYRYDRPAELLVRCGVHRLTGDHPSHEQILTVTSVVPHKQYNNWTKEYDIAVLKLGRQPEENQFVQAACLPTEDNHPGQEAIVAGWGDTTMGGEGPGVLHSISKPILDDNYCKQVPGVFNSDCELCAGHILGGKDSCQGDSGGPLYTQRQGRWTLTGVVSHGQGCAVAGNPGMYADTYQLRDWIDKNINN